MRDELLNETIFYNVGTALPPSLASVYGYAFRMFQVENRRHHAARRCGAKSHGLREYGFR
jgi:hypothetical protein